MELCRSAPSRAHSKWLYGAAGSAKLGDVEDRLGLASIRSPAKTLKGRDAAARKQEIAGHHGHVHNPSNSNPRTYPRTFRGGDVLETSWKRHRQRKESLSRGWWKLLEEMQR